MQQQVDKSKVELFKQIIAIAQPLSEMYFQNEEFNGKLQEWYGEEFKMIALLSNLAKDITEEAKSETFSIKKMKVLMKQLSEILTSKRQIMSFEFKESGLL